MRSFAAPDSVVVSSVTRGVRASAPVANGSESCTRSAPVAESYSSVRKTSRRPLSEVATSAAASSHGTHRPAEPPPDGRAGEPSLGDGWPFEAGLGWPFEAGLGWPFEAGLGDGWPFEAAL